MPYNLLADPVAPFLLASGEVRWLALADIVAGHPNGDYAVEPAWPRADLDTATYELLIGLLSFVMAPKDRKEWRTHYRTPPLPEELGAALAPLLPAFDVDGDGPRFLQEAGLDGDANPVEALFIDTPGVNGQKKNTDLLTHRGRYGGLCLPAAAMALYALQAFAPEGGRGNMTSMRGGGPMTALVMPEGEQGGPPLPLWHRLWANVATHDKEAPSAATVFAWLRTDLPIGKGEKHGGIKLHQGAPSFDERLHPFFGMPRRILLIVSEQAGACAMTGREGPLVTGFAQKPNGLNYGAWIHPLTPYRRQKPAEIPYPVKPKSGRFGYRDWVAVTVGDSGEGSRSLSMAAQNVQRARHDYTDALSAKDTRPRARVRVSGWAMNKKEAISYLVAEQPLPLASLADVDFMDKLARGMASAGDIVSSALRHAIKSALAIKDERGVVEQARTAFYEHTDDAFHDLLGAMVLEAGVQGREEAVGRWLKALRRVALQMFDKACPVPLEDAEKAHRVVKARAFLDAALRGWGKTGKQLYDTLHLPLPQKREAKEEEPA